MSTNVNRPPRAIARWVVTAGLIVLVGFAARTLTAAPERLPSAASAAMAAAPEADAAPAVRDEASPTTSPTTSPTSTTSTSSTNSTTSNSTTSTSTTSNSTTSSSSTSSTTTVIDTHVGAVPTTMPPGGIDDLGYPAAPDGSPLPVVVVYDSDTITLIGEVPSERAKERLGMLAIANAQHEATLVNQLIVNDRVPISVGVRVIELESVRFPEGSSAVLPEHAEQFRRVAAVLEGLPNVTVLVIGHADQRGDATSNLQLSDDRARSVVNYLTYLGIAPTRISSRATGETELLTVDDDDISLALNRRTEFVFFGVLVE